MVDSSSDKTDFLRSCVLSKSPEIQSHILMTAFVWSKDLLRTGHITAHLLLAAFISMLTLLSLKRVVSLNASGHMWEHTPRAFQEEIGTTTKAWYHQPVDSLVWFSFSQSQLRTKRNSNYPDCVQGTHLFRLHKSTSRF